MTGLLQLSRFVVRLAGEWLRRCAVRLVVWVIVGLALLSASGFPAVANSQDNRVALVIGNAAYDRTTPLKNPLNDARAIADRLAELNFDVSLALDTTSGQMRKALDDFKPKASGADIALVFFAGHGIEMGGENYLIPVNAHMDTEAQAQLEAIALDEVEQAVQDASGLAIIILDACRNNPFVQTMIRLNANRSVSRGLAPVKLSRSGAIVGFSASAGRVAQDGAGRHSPYAAALLQVLQEPGVEIGLLFRRVAGLVIEATGGQQEPTIQAKLTAQEYYLYPSETGVAPKGVVVQPDLTPEPVHGATRVNLTECDRLAGYRFLPRVEGDIGREFSQIPATQAITACENAIAAHPEETYFYLLLSRALLAQKKSDPGIHDALLQSADQYPAFTADRLGLLSEHGLGGQRLDIKLAARRYEQSCNAGSAMGCTSHGRVLRRGIGRPVDRDAAILAYEKGCDLDFPQACNELGSIYDLSSGRYFDPVSAILAYVKACDIGYGLGCMNAGSMYRGGIGTRKNPAKAVKLYREACRQTEVLACVWAGAIHEDELSDFDEAALLYFDALSRGIKYRAIRDQSFKKVETRKAFQILMRETGFYNGAIDGKFGPGTIGAINRLCKC